MLSSYWFFGHYITTTVILSIAVVATLTGNVLVATAAFSKSNRCQPEMWILLNLCLVNILFSVVVIPTEIVHGYLFVSWYLDRAMCKFVPYALHVIIYVICYTLGLHSAILFIASHFRKSVYQRITRKVVLVTLACLWAVCFLVCVPTAVYIDLIEGFNYRSCIYRRDIHMAKTDSILRFVFLLLLPFLTMVGVTCSALWRISRVSTRQVAYESLSESEVPKHRRTAVLLLVLLFLFLVCWFPLYVITIVSLHFRPSIPDLTLYTAAEVLEVLAMLNPCIVPYVHLWLDPRIVAGIKSVCSRNKRARETLAHAHNPLENVDEKL